MTKTLDTVSWLYRTLASRSACLREVRITGSAVIWAATQLGDRVFHVATGNPPPFARLSSFLQQLLSEKSGTNVGQSTSQRESTALTSFSVYI